MHTPGSAVSGFTVLLIVQLGFVIVFAVYTKYGDELLPPDVVVMDPEPGELMDGKNHSAALSKGNCDDIVRGRGESDR